MFAQRNLQLTRIELWIPACFFTKNSQKNGRKFRENWNMVLSVGDDVEWHFQSPGMPSRYGNLAKNTQKINKKIQMLLRMSCTDTHGYCYLNPFISPLVGQTLSHPFHSKHIFIGKMAVVYTEILQEPYSTFSLRNSFYPEESSRGCIPRTVCSVHCYIW